MANLPGFEAGLNKSGREVTFSVVEFNFEKVGKKVGLVTGGFPEGFTILVGFVRSGNITAGISSMVVQVTRDG